MNRIEQAILDTQADYRARGYVVAWPAGFPAAVVSQIPDPNTDGELLAMAWAIIANVGGGDWTKETPEWQRSAAAWRDDWHRKLAGYRTENAR